MQDIIFLNDDEFQEKLTAKIQRLKELADFKAEKIFADKKEGIETEAVKRHQSLVNLEVAKLTAIVNSAELTTQSASIALQKLITFEIPENLKTDARIIETIESGKKYLNGIIEEIKLENQILFENAEIQKISQLVLDCGNREDRLQNAKKVLLETTNNHGSAAIQNAIDAAIIRVDGSLKSIEDSHNAPPMSIPPNWEKQAAEKSGDQSHYFEVPAPVAVAAPAQQENATWRASFEVDLVFKDVGTHEQITAFLIKRYPETMAAFKKETDAIRAERQAKGFSVSSDFFNVSKS